MAKKKVKRKIVKKRILRKNKSVAKSPKLIKKMRGPSNKSKVTKVNKLKSIALVRKKQPKKWSFNLFKPRVK